MAASTAILGFGTTFAIGDGGDPETFTALAEVLDVSPPSDAVDVIEVTHMTSPSRTKEFIAGLTDPGEVSFSINFIPGAGDDTALQALRNTGVSNNFRIAFPDSGDTTWTFAAFLTGYTPTAPVNDRMTADVTFKLTGSYTAA